MGKVIWTIGTQGRKPEQVASMLRGAGVDILVDVRANPSAPFDPCSEEHLSPALAAVEVTYWSERNLGVPSAMRRLSAGGDKEERLRHVLRWYADNLDVAPLGVARALERVLGAIADGRALALLCYEHNQWTCHRSVLAEHLAVMVHGLGVVHL